MTNSSRSAAAPPKPQVSVIVAVHNAQPYLDAAIESILCQTLQDLELIAFDDGSTDESLQTLHAWMRRDPRVVVIAAQKAGVVAARNRAIAAARSPLVALMDADDWCSPQRLEIQLGYLREHPDCVAVSGRVLLVDPDGEPIQLVRVLREHAAIEAALLQGQGDAFMHAAAMIRKAAFDAVGGYRPALEFAEDIDLFLRLLEVGRLHNLPEVVYHWRQHLASLSHAKVDLQFFAAQRAVAEARGRRGLGPVRARSFRLPPPRTAPEREFSWARMAAAGGYPGTARKYVGRFLRRAPWSPYGWYVTGRCLADLSLRRLRGLPFEAPLSDQRHA